MDGVYLLFIFSTFSIFIFFIRPLTVLIHELGHAIPAILLTKKGSAIYIGSYGDPQKSFRIKLGRLEAWFRRNPFRWQRGLHKSSATHASVNRQIIYVVGGPLASTIVAIAALYMAFFFDVHGLLKLISIIFLFSAFIDLLVNLIPDNRPIQLFDGGIIYNDGHRLAKLFGTKRDLRAYSTMVKEHQAGKYKRAGSIAATLLTAEFTKDATFAVYRIAYFSNYFTGNYKQALDLLNQFAQHFEYEAYDYLYLGLVHGHLDHLENSLQCFSQALMLEPNNPLALVNRGYILNLLQRYDDALADFDKAIALDPAVAYSYSNRALTKFKQGRVPEAMSDIQQSQTLDPNDAFAHKSMGIYHLDKGENQLAQQHFQRARALDKNIHQIDQLLAQVQDTTIH